GSRFSWLASQALPALFRPRWVQTPSLWGREQPTRRGEPPRQATPGRPLPTIPDRCSGVQTESGRHHDGRQDGRVLPQAEAQSFREFSFSAVGQTLPGGLQAHWAAPKGFELFPTSLLPYLASPGASALRLQGTSPPRPCLTAGLPRSTKAVCGGAGCDLSQVSVTSGNHAIAGSIRADRGHQ